MKKKKFDGYDDLDDWSAAAALGALALLIGALFWWPLILVSWHYWVE